ncbi:hypothetical protein C8F01DRAFT_1226922 [Mycena amicta]|nr:hypothetical protein C8F01DRAFT_1226922 [Mycena amicta]
MSHDDPDILEQLSGIKILLQERSLARAEWARYEQERQMISDKRREETQALEDHVREMLQIFTKERAKESKTQQRNGKYDGEAVSELLTANHRERIAEIRDLVQTDHPLNARLTRSTQSLLQCTNTCVTNSRLRRYTLLPIIMNIVLAVRSGSSGIFRGWDRKPHASKPSANLRRSGLHGLSTPDRESQLRQDFVRLFPSIITGAPHSISVVLRYAELIGISVSRDWPPNGPMTRCVHTVSASLSAQRRRWGMLAAGLVSPFTKNVDIFPTRTRDDLEKMRFGLQGVVVLQTFIIDAIPFDASNTPSNLVTWRVEGEGLAIPGPGSPQQHRFGLTPARAVAACEGAINSNATPLWPVLWPKTVNTTTPAINGHWWAMPVAPIERRPSFGTLTTAKKYHISFYEILREPPCGWLSWEAGSTGWSLAVAYVTRWVKMSDKRREAHRKVHRSSTGPSHTFSCGDGESSEASGGLVRSTRALWRAQSRHFRPRRRDILAPRYLWGTRVIYGRRMVRGADIDLDD